jgi:hypothetical protein
MADYIESAPAGRGTSPLQARAGSMVNYLGAAVSLALIVGVAVWGYRIVVRDVTGVPVVRAMDGPMRQAPETPGGDIALNTGLSVNTIAAMGEAAPPEDRLVLAPPQLGLSEADLEAQPMAEADEVLASATAGPEVTEPVALEDEGAGALAIATAPETVADAPQIAETLTDEQVQALADSIAAGTAPLTDLAAGTDAPVEVSVEGVAGEEMIAASVPGLAQSRRPAARPASLATTVEAAAPPAAADSAPPDAAVPVQVTTAAIPSGTNLVQLGAFESPEIAAAEWTRLEGRFADYMAGKDQVIQQATSGGRTFFRLRAMGFTDLSDARRFCSALVAEDAACIPVVVR